MSSILMNLGVGIALIVVATCMWVLPRERTLSRVALPISVLAFGLIVTALVLDALS